MILTILFWVFAGLFAFKILWNTFTPCVLAWELFKGGAEKTRSVTLMSFVEIALLLILILLSYLSDDSAWFHRPSQVALWGSVVIVGSYILLFVLGNGLGWLVVQIKKRRA
jgi:hypothetical protein